MCMFLCLCECLLLLYGFLPRPKECFWSNRDGVCELPSVETENQTPFSLKSIKVSHLLNCLSFLSKLWIETGFSLPGLMFTTMFYMTLGGLIIPSRLPGLRFLNNLILESPWLGSSIKSDSMLWFVNVGWYVRLCRSFNDTTTTFWKMETCSLWDE